MTNVKMTTKMRLNTIIYVPTMDHETLGSKHIDTNTNRQFTNYFSNGLQLDILLRG